MLYPKDYTGCKVIIRDDDTNAIIAKTTVIDFDKKELCVTVDSRGYDLTMHKRLTLDIFDGKSIYEYKGAFRRTRISNQIDISVFQGRLKEERTSKRFAINTPAKACLAFPNRVAFDVEVVDISTNGLMIKARSNAFDKNDHITITLDVGDQITEMTATVVRITEYDKQNCLYGCKLVSVE